MSNPATPPPPGVELGPGVVLPEDLVTETVAILGKRGSGKTTTARVIAEGLLDIDLPVLIIDPTGVWWGLRTSADGTSDGYPVVIFGGDHGDAPLEETAGDLIARVTTARGLSAVMDLSHLSKTAARRFTADFLARIYADGKDPRHVIIDEADLFAPKFPTRDTARVLGAMEDLFRRGRVKGLGATAISQRPASLHNDLLGMAEVLLTFRMTGTRDVAAIDDWVSLHADTDDARELKHSLPSLPVGTGWLWSPGWLEILRRVQVRQPRTFDSSATPRPGLQRPNVSRMAAVDLAALGEQITASLEERKRDDPAELRRTIESLQRDLAARTPEPAAVPNPIRIEVPVRVEVPVLDPAAVTELRHALESWETHGQQLLVAAADLGRQLAKAQALHLSPTPAPPTHQASKPVSPAAKTPTEQSDEHPDGSGPTTPLPKAQRAVLTALAQHGTRTAVQVALLTGYSHKSGGFRNALSSLRTAGLVAGRGELTATTQGLHTLGSFDPLPTGPDLITWWKDHHLGRAERAILDVLANRTPHAVAIADLAELTGYSASSGGFRNALSRLRSLELASGRGELQLNPTLAG